MAALRTHLAECFDQLLPDLIQFSSLLDFDT